MPDSKILIIVATRCKADMEDKFNQWYNDIHVPMLMKYDGLKKANRYKLAGDDAEHDKYLAFYEFESEQARVDYESSPEFTAAMEEMEGSWPDGGIDIVWMADYSLIKAWSK